MKETLLPTPKELTLDQINQRFATDETARAYWESIHWPKGPVCPHCKNADAKRIWKVTPNEAKKIRAGLYVCAECNKQFTSTIGTIFEDSHIPLRKWLIAWYMLCSSKKGISSLQLQRNLDLGSYRTALFMTHRIRHALQEPVFKDKLTGTIEADETYVGGKTRGRGRHFMGNKVPVFSLVERGGRVRSQVMKYVTGKNLKAALKSNVEPTATIMTDELPAYRKAAKEFASHQAVNHSAGEYVRGLAHTQSVDGFFSLLKRGVVGTFHHISEQHLPLYLAEFDHRHNTRFLTDGERTVIGLQKANGKRLTYRQPMSK
jgi:transposase-like protein/DNA-directed RNA polymerase subunit RPC12/RpoP